MDNSRYEPIKYYIIPELELVIECWFGEITCEKIVSCRVKQSEDSNWDINYKTLCDTRMAHFPDAEAEVQKIIQYVEKNRKWAGKRITVHLTDSPSHVVFQTLMNIYKPRDFKNILGAFSTLDPALQWLNIDLKESSRIEKILLSLKKNRD